MTVYKVGDSVRTVRDVAGYPEVAVGTTVTVTDTFTNNSLLKVASADGLEFSVFVSEIEKVVRFAVGDKVVTSNAPSPLRSALRDLGAVINGDGEFERTVSCVDADGSLVTFEYFSQDIWFDSQYFEVVKKPRVFEVGDVLTEGEMLDLPNKSVVLSQRTGAPILIRSGSDAVYGVFASGGESQLTKWGTGTYTVLHLGESL